MKASKKSKRVPINIGKLPTAEIARDIVLYGIRRKTSTIRVQVRKKYLKIFEKGQPDGIFEETARVNIRKSGRVIAHLKALGGLITGEHRKVQVGQQNFIIAPPAPIGRKIRVISIPDLKGREEVIVDLVP